MNSDSSPSSEAHANQSHLDKNAHEDENIERESNDKEQQRFRNKNGDDEEALSSSSLPPCRWWKSLVRRIIGERQLAVKSTTTLSVLICAALYLMYKYYWKSPRRNQSNNNKKPYKTKRKSSTNGPALLQLWWPAFWWVRRLSNNGRSNYDKTSHAITSLPRGSSTQVVPLSALLQAAKAGSVERVLFRASQIWFQTKDSAHDDTTPNKSLIPPSWKTTHFPPVNQYNSQQLQADLFDVLQRSGATIAALPESIWQKLATPALAALPFVYLALLYRMMHKLQHGDNENNMKRVTASDASSGTTFADVAGLDHVLIEVSEIVQYLHHPTAYHGVGARPPRAILLHGPPGSGKTLLARAVAGEAETLFYACSASEFVETYVGRGAARVRSVFRNARGEAKKKWQQRQQQQRRSGQPQSGVATAILFIDELDALAKTRSSGLLASSNDERDQTLNQLLTEMDGFYHHDDDNVTLIVIAATNRVDVLDPAILRRFDRQVHVGYPDAQGRKAILLVHAKKIKLDKNEISKNRIRWDDLASDQVTGNFSGADLRNVVNEAALLAVRENCTTVQEKHLFQAAQRIREMKKHVQQQPQVYHFSSRGSSQQPYISPFELDEFH